MSLGLFIGLLYILSLLFIPQNQLPDVAKAFEDLGVKVHMFASQWFLTLFMTKFPLNLVFRIFDIFLAEVSLVLLFLFSFLNIHGTYELHF